MSGRERLLRGIRQHREEASLFQSSEAQRDHERHGFSDSSSCAPRQTAAGTKTREHLASAREMGPKKLGIDPPSPNAASVKIESPSAASTPLAELPSAEYNVDTCRRAMAFLLQED